MNDSQKENLALFVLNVVSDEAYPQLVDVFINSPDNVGGQAQMLCAFVDVVDAYNSIEASTPDMYEKYDWYIALDHLAAEYLHTVISSNNIDVDYDTLVSLALDAATV
jgi:hypothetical protein